MGEQARKRARKGHAAAPPRPGPAADAGPDSDLGGLYDFLPPPDPVKDAQAQVEADKKLFARPKLPAMEPNRVIFLDVDGVLLPVGAVETVVVDGVPVPIKDTVSESDFSSAALGNLRSIVQQTGATIVLSSEWRRTDKLRSSINAVLKSQDLLGLRDATVIFSPKLEIARRDPILAWCERRAREIGQWLKDHPEVTAWVAIDDLDFAWADAVRSVGTPWIKYRSVRTHDKRCITDDDAALAVSILLDPPPEPNPNPNPRAARRPREAQVEEAADVGLFVTTEDSMPERIRFG